MCACATGCRLWTAACCKTLQAVLRLEQLLSNALCIPQRIPPLLQQNALRGILEGFQFERTLSAHG